MKHRTVLGGADALALNAAHATHAHDAEPSVDVTTVHAENADFVWRTLQRMGVHDTDLEDVMQEVFIVVHRRLDSFDRSARMTTWLFAICTRVASAYRRKAHRRHEHPSDSPPDAPAPTSGGPHAQLEARQAMNRLSSILDAMDVDKRAVFVMFEIDEMPCDQIASLLDVPVGTVHSRLYAARKSFETILGRTRAREGGTR